MNTIPARIESMYHRMPKAEKRVASYISAHTGQVPLLTVEQIAENSGTSVATVSRFVKKLGYPGLRAFKVDLARTGSEEEDALFQGIGPDDTDREVLRKIFQGNRQSLKDSLALLDPGEVVECVRKLAEKNRIIFFGIGSSGFLAGDAAMRFRFLGFQTGAYTDPAEMTFNAATADEHTGVIALSHSGRSVLTVESAAMAGEQGALTVGISNYPGAPLSRACRHNFYTSFPETSVRVAALSGRVAQLCIIDALYLLTARYRTPLYDLKGISILTDNLLRRKQAERRK